MVKSDQWDKKHQKLPRRYELVGPLLRAARQAKDFSQGDVTAKLQLFGWDIGRTTWTKIELGQRTLSDCELIAVADVLGLSLDTLASEVQRSQVRRILTSLRR